MRFRDRIASCILRNWCEGHPPRAQNDPSIPIPVRRRLRPFRPFWVGFATNLSVPVLPKWRHQLLLWESRKRYPQSERWIQIRNDTTPSRTKHADCVLPRRNCIDHDSTYGSIPPVLFPWRRLVRIAVVALWCLPATE